LSSAGPLWIEVLHTVKWTCNLFLSTHFVSDQNFSLLLYSCFGLKQQQHQQNFFPEQVGVG
jgi:hypothetical protein